MWPMRGHIGTLDCLLRFCPWRSASAICLTRFWRESWKRPSGDRRFCDGGSRCLSSLEILNRPNRGMGAW